MDATVVLGSQGRLVIPAEIRAALALTPGERLKVQLRSRGVLVVGRPQDTRDELQALADNLAKVRSLIDEMSARRQSAPETLPDFIPTQAGRTIDIREPARAGRRAKRG